MIMLYETRTLEMMSKSQIGGITEKMKYQKELNNRPLSLPLRTLLDGTYRLENARQSHELERT